MLSIPVNRAALVSLFANSISLLPLGRIGLPLLLTTQQCHALNGAENRHMGIATSPSFIAACGFVEEACGQAQASCPIANPESYARSTY